MAGWQAGLDCGMTDGVIRIVNARQHNLKGITVDLPRRALVVVTGPSARMADALSTALLVSTSGRPFVPLGYEYELRHEAV